MMWSRKYLRMSRGWSKWRMHEEVKSEVKDEKPDVEDKKPDL
jgi:hypothetical protein